VPLHNHLQAGFMSLQAKQSFCMPGIMASPASHGALAATADTTLSNHMTLAFF